MRCGGVEVEGSCASFRQRRDIDLATQGRKPFRISTMLSQQHFEDICGTSRRRRVSHIVSSRPVCLIVDLADTMRPPYDHLPAAG
uniref:Uncharacterized protein n=1 Tax=Rhodopseudomonas palustris (strain ATCC BAA-98 / CGA009) TaxID=258594 RepID=Q6NA69_RHOPA|nr:hypothetical protein RPA1316 [Rhodopseudomonas palustris CGA009]